MPVFQIGQSTGYGINSKITIFASNACLETSLLPVLKLWEETSYKLELHQTSKQCADAEFNSLPTRVPPKYALTFDPDTDTSNKLEIIKVAVLREEGSNGDREMAAALVKAGFKVFDVTMQDLLTGESSLDQFRGVIFPGGFSYAGKRIVVS